MSTAVAALMAATGAVAQTDTAYVPFVVNVNATVRAMLLQGVAPCGSPSPQISVTSYVQTYLRIPLEANVGVRYGAQKTLTAPAIVSNGTGKLTLNLPAQSYKNAEIALYSVNGKRMLRQKASAANTANSISLPNAAPGAYLLSVKGADGGGFTSRLTHSGGNLAITVVFGGENRPAAARQLAKEAAVPCIWRITVGEAAGYADTSYWFNPVVGWSNPVQEIYLRYAGSVVTPGDSGTPSGMYSVSVSSEGIGATGSGSYAAGATVSINAGTAPAGQQFKNWTASSNGVTFYNANSAATTFTMPANAVTVAAVFGAASVLSAPANVTATGTSETSITVSWSAVIGAEGYSVFRYTNAAGANSRHITCTSSTTFTDGEVSAGKAYYYRVYAYSGGNVHCNYGDSGVESPRSPYVSATAYPSATFIDYRDEKTYGYVTIIDKRWMAENLNFETTSNSWCYSNNAKNCTTYGRLYTWSAAMAVCPSGWHLPTREEWGDLAIAAGGTGTYGTEGRAGYNLKSRHSWNDYGDKLGSGNDTYGFNALPGGSDLFPAGYSGFWWTAEEYDSDYAYYRSIFNESGYLSEDADNKSLAFSVRCVGD
jgi:uncharacterized protein (TIGR02145 family)